MDRSRSPRVSDEARFLQRLAEPEQAAVTRFLQIIEDIRRDHTFYHDDHGASIPVEPLYTHLLPRYTDILGSTMSLVTQAEAFAAELTAARAAIAAAVAELDAGVSEAHEAMDDPARDSSALRRANNRMAEAYTILSTQQPPTDIAVNALQPFTGQGNRLGE